MAVPDKPDSAADQDDYPVKEAFKANVIDSVQKDRAIVALYAADMAMCITFDVSGMLVMRGLIDEWLRKYG